MLGTSSIASKARRKRIDGKESPSLAVSRLGDDEDLGVERQVNGHAVPGKKNIDDLLPLGVRQTPPQDLARRADVSVSRHHQLHESSFDLRRKRSGHMSWMSISVSAMYFSGSAQRCLLTIVQGACSGNGKRCEYRTVLVDLTFSTPSNWTISRRKRCITLKWATVSSLPLTHRRVRPSWQNTPSRWPQNI